MRLAFLRKSPENALLMDATRAHLMEKEFAGQSLAGWTLGNLLGWGKSGVVFQAEREGSSAAFKVFDRELVDRFGEKTQLSRLQRELSLVGERHPNLVEILEGGRIEEHGLLYIVMEEVKAPSLDTLVPTFPREAIRPTLAQLAKAARFLEERGLVHRDIKPANAAVRLESNATKLLDLGVLRPITGSDLTDTPDPTQFVATTRYTSPEYLLRVEDDSPEGWRALTFYQLGGVLHDMIMRTRLFNEHCGPPARLSNAVQHEVPRIFADDISQDLIQLARSCLVKDPEARLELVSWEDFERGEPSSSAAESAKDRILLRHASAKVQQPVVDPRGVEQERRDNEQFRRDVCSQIQGTIRSIRAGTSVFPPIAISEQTKDNHIEMRIELAASARHSLPSGLDIRLQIRILNTAEQLVTVGVLGYNTESEDPNDSLIVFKGLFEPGVMRAVLDELLHKALDAEQAAAELSEKDVAGPT